MYDISWVEEENKLEISKWYVKNKGFYYLDGKKYLEPYGIKKVVNISCGDEKSVSTVIKFSSNKIKLLRKGPVKLKQIAELLDNKYEYE